MSYRTITPDDLRAMLKDKSVTLLDIRDAGSFAVGHIDGALSAEAVDIDSFVATEDKTQTLVVYCYHGISSRSAAEFFDENGFTDVYSMEGGYAAWE